MVDIKRQIGAIFDTLSFSFNNVNDQWRLFMDIMKSVSDQIAPIKTIQFKAKNNFPWFNRLIVSKMKKRNAAFNKAKRSGLLEHWNLYKVFRNTVAKLIKKAKADCFQKFISGSVTSSKNLWNRLQPYLSPNSKSIILAELFDMSQQQLANCFVNYFSTITNKFTFGKISDSIEFIDSHFNNEKFKKN